MAKKKFSIVNEIHQGVLKSAEVGRAGAIRLKKSDVKNLLESVFSAGAKAAASGDRVRFPIIWDTCSQRREST